MKKNRLKVAILSFYSGLASRGVETFVKELSVRVDGITVYQSDQMPAPGNSLHYLFIDPPGLAIRAFTKKTLRQLKSDPPDIIMALNNGWMSLLAKQFCRRYKTKLVLAGFSGIGWDDKVNLWLKPDCFVACTDFQADWAKSINPGCRVEKINIGVNLDRFKPEGDKYRHGLKPPVVLVVAGPERTKRVELAIRAVSRLDAGLLVVGRQPAEINNLAKKLLGERYKNITVDYEHLDSVYRSCQVFTLPAVNSEAYGISILEAMASGLAVVVNDDPIRRELVGTAGILVDPTDLNSYASGLKIALSLSGKNNRQQALKFSWDKISQQYLNLWSGLI